MLIFLFLLFTAVLGGAILIAKFDDIVEATIGAVLDGIMAVRDFVRKLISR
jgi:hypothetical protein